MMSEMTEEEFWSIWQAGAPGPAQELEYRLYHDENGFPLFYAMEDLPGLFIAVDKDTFLSGPKNIKVIDGKIVEAEIAWLKKIIPSPQGTSCHPEDVCIVVDADQPHTNWRLKHEEPKYDPTN
jgi:hypothetical protein